MNQRTALRLLGEVMQWSDDHARDEYAWLSLMSRLKFDAYEDFSAGARFIERLVAWLLQFDSQHREAAYNFVRRDLLFISKAQVRHLIELVFPEFIRPILERAVAQEMGIRAYQVRANPTAASRFAEMLRATLFLGLSDGARMDDFRRANAGRISNEQVVTATHIDEEKWGDLLESLRKDSGDPGTRFCSVFLLDDFVGSGKTLLRQKPGSGEWTGRMARVWNNLKPHLETHFVEDWRLCVHHYISTWQAEQDLPARNIEAAAVRGRNHWFKDVKFSYSTVLPEGIRLNHPDCRSGFREVIEHLQYYDCGIETQATAVGGSDVRYGFSNCGLPLVLEHNTPNNSVALLWAESEDPVGNRGMRPLFRRRQRHF